MNRREFLRLGAILAGTSAVAVLTACQAPTPAPTAAPTSAPVPTTAPAAKAPTTAPSAPAPTTAGAAPATPPAAAPTPAPAAAGKPGGKLIALTVADPKSLDIQVSQLAQLRQMADSMYDTLTYQDATDLQVKPRLAKEWKWTNPTTLEMTLTDGVTFHEGQPFTAEDVKFNVDRVVDPNTGSPLSAMLEPIDKTDIVDPMHIRFTLKRPWPALIENFSNIKIYSKTATDESIRTKPNGTGPFKFVEWKQNDYIRLQKNQGYWIKGVPFIDEIDFKPVTEQETRISMMETMAADVMFSLELKDIPRIEANNQLSVQRSTFDDNGDILYINNSREPMSNQKLRLAVSYSIDRETFIKQFLAGYGRKNTSPWDKEHWAYSTEANNNAFPYDLEKAKQLLVDAGFPEGKDSSGKQLTLNIIFPVGYPEWKQGSIMLESALKKLGVASKVEELELNVWADRLISTGDFDLSWDFHGGHVTDPAATLALAFFYPPGPKNICRYTDERLGKVIEQGGSAFDQTERKKLYGEYQQRWNEVQPGYIVGQRVMAHATQNFVKGFVTHPLFFQDLRSVYRDK